MNNQPSPNNKIKQTISKKTLANFTSLWSDCPIENSHTYFCYKTRIHFQFTINHESNKERFSPKLVFTSLRSPQSMLACLIQTHTHTNRETEMQLCEQQKRPPVWSHGSALCVCVCIRDIHTLSPLTLTKLSFCRMRLYGASSPTDFWFLL